MSNSGRLSKLLEKLKILEGASYTVVLLGVPTFIVQQYLAVHETRRERSLAIIERFSESDLLAARGIVQEPWYEIPVPLLIEQGLDRDTFDEMVVDLVRQDDALQRSIFQIVDYFESARLCVSARLCDGAIIDTFSQAYATEFDCTYGAYIDTLRVILGTEAAAEGLRSFVRDEADC